MSKDNTESDTTKTLRSAAFLPEIEGQDDGQFDVSEYSEFVDDFDITEQQKRELLETLWSIMRAFVELGFEADICGHIFDESNEATLTSSEGIKLPHSTTKETPGNGRQKG